MRSLSASSPAVKGYFPDGDPLRPAEPAVDADGILVIEEDWSLTDPLDLDAVPAPRPVFVAVLTLDDGREVESVPFPRFEDAARICRAGAAGNPVASYHVAEREATCPECGGVLWHFAGEPYCPDCTKAGPVKPAGFSLPLLNPDAPRRA